MIDAKLYDSNNKEVEVPKDTAPIIGINGVCFMPVDTYSSELVYRPTSNTPNLAKDIIGYNEEN